MLGYWAKGSRDTATKPKMTVRMAMTIATIGRLTKKRTTLPLSERGSGRRRSNRGVGGGGGGAHRHAGPQPRQIRDDHLVADAQSFLDDPEAADLRPRLHHPDVDLAVGADHADLVGALKLVDGLLRHEEGALPHLDHGPHLRVLTRPEDVPGIREGALDSARAGSNGHLAIDDDHRPTGRLEAAVSEDELELVLRTLLGLGRALALGLAQVRSLAGVEAGLDGADLPYRSH